MVFGGLDQDKSDNSELQKLHNKVYDISALKEWMHSAFWDEEKMESILTEEQFGTISSLFFENRLKGLLVEAYEKNDEATSKLLKNIMKENEHLNQEAKTISGKNQIQSMIIDSFKSERKN